MLRAGLTLLAGSGLAAAARAQEEGKIEKSVVQYQDAPKNGQKCADCVQFMPPNACKVVAGSISPNGWCAAFAPKNA